MDPITNTIVSMLQLLRLFLQQLSLVFHAIQSLFSKYLFNSHPYNRYLKYITLNGGFSVKNSYIIIPNE